GMFFGGVGVLIGVLIVNPLSHEYSLRLVPRGCILVLLPGLLAIAGMLVGGVAGAVLVLRAGDPAVFRWLGGGTLGVLFLITWLQRGKKMELQKGLLAGLGLLGVAIVGIALALGVPKSVAVWVAPIFPGAGALFGWQSLPLIRRLVGLFVGMITGFVGAGLAFLVMS
ncbi:MAG TPA: hypothetical protein VI451_15790, partial [Anaerolineales bacterium]|nr:hypothetical protein [Anaerolineales bacterium]